MDLGQTARRWGRSFRAMFAGLRARAGDAAGAAMASAEDLNAPHHRFPRWSKIAAIAVLLVVLFYPLRACWVSDIDDDTAFWPRRVDAGQSNGIAVMAALIDREVNDHSWTPNAPWFTPSGMMLDDMPNYQRGLIAGVARFGVLAKERLGRVGLALDPDLTEAAEKLAYSPDVWMWTWSDSIVPTGSSGGTYLDAMEALERYNARLASRQAMFMVSGANLAYVLDNVGADLDGAAARIDGAVMGVATLTEGFGGRPSEVFYRTKGMIYAEYMVLKGLAKDFAVPIAAHRAVGPWTAMMADLKAAAEARSGAVRGGSPGVLPQPCDLCTQGFFILRARMQMQRIAEALRKP